jgi:hypothetical protein
MFIGAKTDADIGQLRTRIEVIKRDKVPQLLRASV